MRIAPITLSLAISVFLNHMELINSEPRTLEDLFPGYNGVMPPVEKLAYRGQVNNFATFGNESMEYEEAILIRRAHILFGWMLKGHYIYNPCQLFPRLEDVFIAFDMHQGQWFTLSQNLSLKLGASRHYSLVAARDEVAATHVTTSNSPLYKRAHIRACQEANKLANYAEQIQSQLLYVKRTNIENSTEAIKEEYSEAYNRIFMLNLHPHGENHVHGYRKRHA